MTRGNQMGFTTAVVKGGLLAFEWVMRAFAGSMDAAAPRHLAHGSGRVRTASGTVEPLAHDEFGQRVGAVSGSPAIKDE